MSLLDNELVKRYFGCPWHNHKDDKACGSQESTALRILKAMEEPIRSGDRLLVYSEEGQEWIEDFAFKNAAYYPVHLMILRLPDQFQPKKECQCNMNCAECHMQRPDPVEEKIQSIWRNTLHGKDLCLAHLRELVELVRKEAK